MKFRKSRPSRRRMMCGICWGGHGCDKYEQHKGQHICNCGESIYWARRKNIFDVYLFLAGIDG